MTVDEIKEYIDKKIKRYNCRGEGYFTLTDNVNEILFNIKSMLDKLDNKWVDVNDRLPSEFGVYITTRDKGGWSVMGNEVDQNYFDKDNEKWFDDIMRETDITYQVIAWKKVEPYERGE